MYEVLASRVHFTSAKLRPSCGLVEELSPAASARMTVGPGHTYILNIFWQKFSGGREYEGQSFSPPTMLATVRPTDE